MIASSSRTKAVLLGLGIFLLGIVVGATIERWVLLRHGKSRHMPPHAGRPFSEHPVRDRLVHRLNRNLDLTDDQQRKVRRTLDESRRHARDIQRAVREKMDVLSNDTKSKIREDLTPEQREKFDEMTSRIEKKKGHTDRRGGRKRGGWKW